MRPLLLLVSLLLFWSNLSNAANVNSQAQHIPAYDMQQHDQVINKVYQILAEKNHRPITDRVITISQFFLHKPYLLSALGEGAQGQYDQNPLYRADAFDCVTYVSTVLALANANDLRQFKQTIAAINYKDGKPQFKQRNHFMSVDWNPNNQRKGYIKDITNKIVDAKGQPIAAMAVATIDRPNWFKNLKTNQLKLLQEPTSQQANELLQKLHAESNYLKAEEGHLSYLPLTRLFSNGQANEAIFAQIPTGSIIEIVRPNWPLKKLIGTNMNVSHLGFAIRTPQGLMFREASSEEHKVVDIPLTTYLKHYLTSPTVKGINVQIILERK